VPKDETPLLLQRTGLQSSHSRLPLASMRYILPACAPTLLASEARINVMLNAIHRKQSPNDNMRLVLSRAKTLARTDPQQVYNFSRSFCAD
jgi:hypothetical protein